MSEGLAQRGRSRAADAGPAGERGPARRQREAPVIRMINALLPQALRERASDIHIEPYEARARRALSRRRHAARRRRAAARAARCAGLAAEDHGRARHRREAPAAGRAHRAEARRPAGRRARLDAADRRTASASCCACSTRRRRGSTSTTLGMSGDTLDAIDALIRQPHGIVLVTGPTGSGKTTTLYAALSRLPRGTRNIMTVEDPIEYELDGIGQTQVNARIELDVRARAARDPAPGSGRHHDRRDPRPRDRADRRAGVADRPPRARDAAHQRRGERGHAARRHGRRAVPARVEPARRARAAAGAHAVSAVPRRGCAERGRAPLARGPRPAARRSRSGARRAARNATSRASAAAPASTSCCGSTRRCAD